jgi:membrane protein
MLERGQLTVIRAVKGAVRRVRQWLDPVVRGTARARTFGLAAEMSFWVFLSLVPLAAVAGLVAARLAMSHQPLEGTFLSSVAPEARRMIDTQVESLARWNGGKIAPVALVTFLWLASSGVHSIFDALEVQSETTRPWWKKRLLAVATCVCLSAGVALLGLFAVGFDRLAALVGRAMPLRAVGSTFAGGFGRWASGFVVSIAMVAALYRVGIPSEARRRTPVLPGALLAVALIAAVGWGYRLYLSRAGIGDAYLGGLAIIGVTLTTIWLFSVAVLLGAQVNTVIRDRRGAARAAMSPPREHSGPRSAPTHDHADRHGDPACRERRTSRAW